MSESSPVLERFLASMSAGGSREALESYDERAFDTLDDTEREIALQACAARIQHGTNDLRAVRLIVRCGWFDAIDRIDEHLDRIPAHETKAAFLAFAWDWRGRPKYLRELGRLATTAGLMCRLEAVLRLGRLECRDLHDEYVSEIRSSLLAAMDDPEATVVNAAAESLAKWPEVSGV